MEFGNVYEVFELGDLVKMPTISIYKIDGGLIRPANDTDSAYDILYLNNAKYVLAKYIWRPRPNGRGTELVKGVEKVL